MTGHTLVIVLAAHFYLAVAHAHLLTHSLTHSLTHTLTHSYTHSLTHTHTHTHTHSPTHSLTHSLTHTLNHSHTHTHHRWYHPGVSRHIAESLLMHPDILPGTYLMRNSTNSNDSLTLSVR